LILGLDLRLATIAWLLGVGVACDATTKGPDRFAPDTLSPPFEAGTDAPPTTRDAYLPNPGDDRIAPASDARVDGGGSSDTAPVNDAAFAGTWEAVDVAGTIATGSQVSCMKTTFTIAQTSDNVTVAARSFACTAAGTPATVTYPERVLQIVDGRLRANDMVVGTSNASYGFAAALSGDWAVVGAPGASTVYFFTIR
jgi:hypothetical protein